MTSTVGKFRDETFVTVASYLKPELQLSARPLKPQYVRGELARVEIQASYYMVVATEVTIISYQLDCSYLILILFR
jgi:hypothetical protein